MKVGNNGLKINTGLVKMQHKSNMISTMLGGGNSIASLSSLMGGGGSARTQAMSMMKQMDTFDRLSSLTSGDSGAYSPSSAKGTAREQAKELMKEYEESQKAAETASGKTAETVELTKGEEKLSDTAKDYLAGLRKQYADTDFIVAGEGDDEAKLVKASKKEFTVVLSGDEVERMATDEDFAKQQLHSMETIWTMNERINQENGFTRAWGQTGKDTE